ncbi:Solute carrier family 35 member G1 [Amphibalanus amphitrite]|uniref:Solute carrier family 35 member G1 n=1 Tax=Amphibalanus amphitrite TaxID=1232801 RepID=A0A6A4XC41_AMPAM|nr:Solute carrier family 35 member G1 [Amphibalanus amphitrite]
MTYGRCWPFVTPSYRCRPQKGVLSLDLSGDYDSDSAPLPSVTGTRSCRHSVSSCTDVASEKTPLLAPPRPETCGGSADPVSAAPSGGRCSSHLGLLLALFAAFCSSLVNALVKGLSSVDPAALSAFRFAILLVPAMAVAIRRGTSIFPRGRRRTMLVRSVLGTAGLVLKFYAMRLMPLADASVIVLSVPVFVAVFARLWLKEPFTWVNALTIAGTLAGIVLIVRPPFLFGGGTGEGYSAVGPVLACTATVVTSITYVSLRQLRDVHYSATVSVFSLTAVPLSMIVWLTVGDRSLPTTALPWLLVLAVGVLSFLVQMCFTKACQLELAGPVAVARTTDILYAVVWQVVWFDQVPGMYSFIGMALVVISVLLVAARKWYEARHTQEKKPTEGD